MTDETHTPSISEGSCVIADHEKGGTSTNAMSNAKRKRKRKSTSKSKRMRTESVMFIDCGDPNGVNDGLHDLSFKKMGIRSDSFFVKDPPTFSFGVGSTESFRIARTDEIPHGPMDSYVSMKRKRDYSLIGGKIAPNGNFAITFKAIDSYFETKFKFNAGEYAQAYHDHPKHGLQIRKITITPRTVINGTIKKKACVTAMDFKIKKLYKYKGKWYLRIIAISITIAP